MESTDVAGSTEEWDVVAGKVSLLLQVSCQITVKDVSSGILLFQVKQKIGVKIFSIFKSYYLLIIIKIWLKFMN